MLSRPWALAGTLVIAVVVAAPPTVAARPASKCWTSGTTVLANRDARVYTVFDGEPVAFGCLRRRGSRRYVLDVVSRTNGVSEFQLAGAYVGYVVRGAGCSRGACEGDQIGVADLRRRRDRQFPGCEFVLASNGSLALVREEPGGERSVVAIDQDATHTLDTGAIDAGSLALRGSRVYWLNAGEPRTATLR